MRHVNVVQRPTSKDVEAGGCRTNALVVVYETIRGLLSKDIAMLSILESYEAVQSNRNL